MTSLTAKSWDSYMDTLLAILSEFKPKNILEFGSGKSTGVMAMAPSVELIHTYEHDHEYFSKFNKSAFDNLELHLIENQDEYAYHFKNKKKIYDLIFVDGVNRPRCIKESRHFLSQTGVMMLHDAAREEYEDAIKPFKYKIFTDDGHTVTLTDEEHVFDRLQTCLKGVKNIIGVKGCE